jgi:hypothetical protein
MKLIDLKLTEMTMRTGSMEHMQFPNFAELPLKLEGKMQGGHAVYSFNYKHTIFFVVKVGDEFAAFSQLTPRKIPKVGEVLESLNTKVKPEFRGQKLSVKLKHFITLHLGKSILLSDIISVGTEALLPTLAKTFGMKIVNVVTGETVEWSREAFERLTSIETATPWQMLLGGNPMPFKESHTIYDGITDDRHKWTYFDFFEKVDASMCDDF